MAITCTQCGYARNADSDRSCSLCGKVLVKGAAPGDTVVPAEPPPTLVPPPAPAPVPAAAADVPDPEKSGMFSRGGLCHLKCSLLERPIRLTPDRVYTVGRAKESDIAVPSQMVSRHHGQFLFEKGVWVYVDLKSSNGSRVGGKRVERVVLQSGDVVDVGGFMITYKEIHDLSQVTETPEDEGKTMAIDPSMLKRAALAGVDGVALLGGLGGSLADISMPDILQLLEMQKKNGTLSFDFEGAYGKIFLKNGMMIHAEYGKLTGEIAVTRMLHKAKGTFHLDPRDPKTEQSIHRPTTTVLMDAARSMDERAQ